MTADRFAPGPDSVRERPPPDDRRPTARPLVNPPSPDSTSRHGRRRAGGRPRHPDEVGDAQGPPPAVRTADAGLRPRRLGEHRGRRGGRRARSSSSRRRSPRSSTSSPIGRSSPSRTSRAAPATRSGAALGDRARRGDRDPRPVRRRAAGHRRATSSRSSRRAARTMPRSRWPASSPPTRPSSGASCAASSGRSSGSSRRRTPTPEELAGNEINAGLYAFDAAWLRRRIAALAPSAATGELYLTDLVRLAREDGRIVSAVAFEDDGRFDGINDRSQLAAAEWSMRVRLNEAHMRNGVTMRDPSTVYLDWTVELGPDVTLEPNVILRGATSVGAGSVIGAGSQLIDATVGAGARGLGEHRRVVDDRGRGDGRPVQPPAPGERRRTRRRGRQLRRAQEHASRRRLEAAPHELPRRRRGRRGGQHRGRHDHRQLRRHDASTRRRSATGRSSASTR